MVETRKKRHFLSLVGGLMAVGTKICGDGAGAFCLVGMDKGMVWTPGRRWATFAMLFAFVDALFTPMFTLVLPVLTLVLTFDMTVCLSYPVIFFCDADVHLGVVGPRSSEIVYRHLLGMLAQLVRAPVL